VPHGADERGAGRTQNLAAQLDGLASHASSTGIGVMTSISTPFGSRVMK
jgi:hypothetical protein